MKDKIHKITVGIVPAIVVLFAAMLVLGGFAVSASAAPGDAPSVGDRTYAQIPEPACSGVSWVHCLPPPTTPCLWPGDMCYPQSPHPPVCMGLECQTAPPTCMGGICGDTGQYIHSPGVTDVHVADDSQSLEVSTAVEGPNAAAEESSTQSEGESGGAVTVEVGSVQSDEGSSETSAESTNEAHEQNSVTTVDIDVTEMQNGGADVDDVANVDGDTGVSDITQNVADDVQAVSVGSTNQVSRVQKTTEIQDS